MWLSNRPTPAESHLRGLVDQISRGDRAAFATFFDDTSPALHGHLLVLTGDPAWATRVVTATYVEVWWLAGCHTGPDDDAKAWITQIANRRVDECRPERPPQGGVRLVPDQRPRYAVIELAGLLGRPIESLSSGAPGSLHHRTQEPISNT